MQNNERINHITMSGHSDTNHLNQWVEAFALPLIITLAGVTIFRGVVTRSIMSSAHPVLVYVILAAFFLGLFLCATALLRYQKESNYIKMWRAHKLGGKGSHPLLGIHRAHEISSSIPLSTLDMNLSPTERHSSFELEVETVNTAFGEKLAYANYIAGALIGLGLVGTFIGLLGTLEDLGAVFGTLAQSGSSDANPTVVFGNMVNKLQEPMKGMGTAFVASLYGLLGSLLVGLSVLSVSRAGGAVVNDLYTAERIQAALDPKNAEGRKANDTSPRVEQLEGLVEKLALSQVESEVRMQSGLERGVNRLVKFLTQSVESSWEASAQMQNQQQRFLDQLASTMSNQEGNELSGSARGAAKPRSAKDRLAEAMVTEPLRAPSGVEESAVPKSIVNLSKLTDRSKLALQDYLQKQAAQEHVVVTRRTASGATPAAKHDTEAEQSDGLSKLAKSIERQTDIIEGLFRRVQATNYEKSSRD